MVDVTEDFFVTTGTVSGDTITGGTTVKISTFSVDFDYAKDLIDIPLPVPQDQRGSTDPQRLLIDLLQVKQAITVNGVLTDEASISALEKKNNLLNIANSGGTCTVVWGKSADNQQQKYTVNINKMKFSEKVGAIKEDESVTPYRKIGFTGVFVIGVDK